MRLATGIIILIICCALAFLIPKVWVNNNCEGGTCPPTERRVNNMWDWLIGLDWYWFAGILAAVAAAFYWFFVK